MKLRENHHQQKNQILIVTVKGIGTLFLAGYMTLAGMKCSNPTTPDIPVPPHQITVKVDFYNHTQGIIGEKTYTGMSSQPGLIIRVNDCPNTSTIDSKRIAVRQESQTIGLGKLVMFSRTGETNTDFPEENTT